jgi:hypothetical protein
MPEVVVVAPGSTYKGFLSLSPTVGPEIRLLDGLNTPQRLKYGLNKPNTGFLLENPVRTDRRDGSSTPLGAEIILRPQQIVAAYEAGESTSRGGEAVYETRSHGREDKVVIHTSNGLRLEGVAAGGIHALETPKNLLQFFPFTQVMVLDLTLNHNPEFIPFMAVNLAKVESFGVIG